MQNKIDEAYKMWNKTRDPKYKELWYKLVEEWADEHDNTTRRDILSSRSDKTPVHRFIFTRDN